MLLDAGADPNRKVRGEQRNAILRPPLAELLASNDNVSCDEVRLLLRAGAKVSDFILLLVFESLTEWRAVLGCDEDSVP